MAKRSDSAHIDGSVGRPILVPATEPVLEPVIEPVLTKKLDIDPKPAITYNKVTNRLPSRVIRYGSYTGIRYEWQPGQTINVQAEDSNEMRNLSFGGQPCCGQPANLIFEVLEV
jgi:hypothetical protein